MGQVDVREGDGSAGTKLEMGRYIAGALEHHHLDLLHRHHLALRKHVLSALCEDLRGPNGQKCTKQLHCPNPYYPSVLQSTLHPQSCRSCVAAAPVSAQIAGSTCESPARKHAHDEPREAQTASTRCATIADRSKPVPGWMSMCAGRREPPATRNSPHASPDLP